MPIDPDFMTLPLCAMYLKDNLTDELQRFIDAVKDCYAEACPGEALPGRQRREALYFAPATRGARSRKKRQFWQAS